MSAPITVATPVVAALNALLRREAWAAHALGEHAGKTVAVSAGEPWRLCVRIGADGLLRSVPWEATPAVSFRVAEDQRGQLLAAWRARGADGVLQGVHIEGDAALAQCLSGLARDLRWDVEDELAQRVGDVAALRLMAGARALRSALSTAVARTRANVAEYAQHEASGLLTQAVWTPWVAQRQALDARLARLEARLAGEGAP